MHFLWLCNWKAFIKPFLGNLEFLNVCFFFNCKTIIFQPLPHRQDAASLSLLYHYFYGKWSDELPSLVLLVLTFMTDPPCHLHCSKQPSVFLWWEVSSTWTVSSQEPLIYGTSSQEDVSPNHYNLNVFKSRINSYLHKLPLNVTLYLKWLKALYRVNLNFFFKKKQKERQSGYW